MSYYFSKILKGIDFERAIELVRASLKEQGFGVLSDIDVTSTLKNKIDVDFKKYRILGACHPHYAHQALTNEDKIGVFLPCNVVVEEHEDGSIEVAAVDPIASMMSVENEALGNIAVQIQQKLKVVVSNLK